MLSRVPKKFRDVDHFVEALKIPPSGDKYRNFYHNGPSKEETPQAKNVRSYLRRMYEIGPRVMLLGEAPGYRGCAMSGVPFMSVKTLENLGHFWDFEVTRPENPEFVSEISADCVFKTLIRLNIKPLIWNVFCFHPHAPHVPKTNRTPLKSELVKHKKYLSGILQLFDPQVIACVGRTSQNFIETIDEYQHYVHERRAYYVRHPSFGGASVFNQTMEGLVNTLREIKVEI